MGSPDVVSGAAGQIEKMSSEDPLLNAIYTRFADQAEHPPAKDQVIGSFYQAVLDYAAANPVVTQCFEAVLDKRERHITPNLFVNLAFRVAQYFQQKGAQVDQIPTLPYTTYKEPEQWEPFVKRLFNENAQLFVELMERDTTTTIWQRYAGPKVVLSTLFDDQPIKVADFGCGGNYGLPGMVKQLPFEQIIDDTPGDFVTKIINKPVNVTGIGIDRQDNSDPEVRTWRLSNSFYPSELQKLPQYLALEASLADQGTIHFAQADLLKLDPDKLIQYSNGTINHGPFDAVIMSTICYQLSQPQQFLLLDTANKLVKNDGVVIIQDFAEKDPQNPAWLNFDVSWFAGGFGYRTFVTGPRTNSQILEVFRWADGRCGEVKPGEDFEKLLALRK